MTQEYEVISVLGGPGRSRDRLEKALEAYNKGYAPYMLVTDFFQHENMSDYLKERGVPEDRIVQEKRARTTKQNVAYTIEICEERGWKSIIFSTSYYHCKRLVKNIKEEFPEGYRTNWIYERTNFTDVRQVGVLFLRLVHELAANFVEGSLDNDSAGSSAVIDKLMGLEQKIFKRFKAA